MATNAEEQNIYGDDGDEYEEEYEEIEVEEEVEEEEDAKDDMADGADGGGGSGGEEKKDSQKANGGGNDSGHSLSDGSSSEGKIFVGGVAWETTEDTFSKHFKKYGEITDSVIMKDKHTRMPRGFGFITFADPSVVEEVLNDDHVIDGRTVEVKRTVPRETMPSKGNIKTKKIFVGGIPTSLTEDEFKEYFAAYGTVVEHQIMVDHSTGRSRGFGFITFEKEDTVDEIMKEGKTHELGGKTVELKRAVPKSAGGDPGSKRRSGSGSRSGGANMYGAYGYGGGYGAVGGRAAAGAYGRGYGYGGYGYPMGFAGGYGASMYYGAGNYGAQGYGFYGVGGYGTGGRQGGRYHPYGR